MKTTMLLTLSFAAANATSIIVSATPGQFTTRTGMSTPASGGVAYTIQDGVATFANGTWTIGSAQQIGQVLLTFDKPITYFGIDVLAAVPLSAICFYTESAWIGTLYGGQMGGGYLNFDIKEAGWGVKYVILWSERGSFVSDNHAFGVSNPEGSTAAMMAFGIAALGGLRLRKYGR